jgi:hypothetical protein
MKKTVAVITLIVTMVTAQPGGCGVRKGPPNYDGGVVDKWRMTTRPDGTKKYEVLVRGYGPARDIENWWELSATDYPKCAHHGIDWPTCKKDAS